MYVHRLVFSITVVLASCGLAADAFAQATAQSPARSELRIDTAAAIESIRADEFRRFQGRDGVGNGIRNGIIAGAAAGAGFGIFVSRVFCETDDCLAQLGRDWPAVLFLSGIGAGIGAVAGWAIDASLDGRPVYGRQPSKLRMAPVVSRDVRGLRATFSWR
jgi:hypothetical protein